jgi:predicted Fe-Mo cluster-binding NifX family protein
MKVAVSSDGKDMNSMTGSAFGRCRYFIMAGIEDGRIKFLEAAENKASEQAGKAGIAAAKLVAGKEAQAVISGEIGPRAMEVFRQFGIKAYRGSGKVSAVLEKFMEGKLPEL